MMALKIIPVIVILCTLVLNIWYSEGCLPFRSSSSSSNHDDDNFPHDINTKSDLTVLYNKRVIWVDNYKRPLGSFTWMWGRFYHAGVVVTTADGDKWLIHKGDSFGKSSQTVVVCAKCMSSRWVRVGGHSVSYAKVGDYVGAGGIDYNFFADNCQDARDRMLELD
ncbi:hypothetical protein LSH36_188g07071 [Paralvinella palmiformis]|uniref:Uncharacterized protein n=1 Tax=Paralvinella palmiformis TaxID=53620 RepID=A0AAD9JQP4_9ANNE|nr:hypothetical protein LSH36_188g07071 [Paralvinella palmiformis]